jgi:hypothetical protein
MQCVLLNLKLKLFKEKKMDYDNIVDTQRGMAQMLGKTFVQVTGDVGGYEMTFVTAQGERFMFAHEQDCCERVDINDIVGDLQDLVGEPLLVAEEVRGETPVEFDEGDHESVTWTLYKFATRKGYVDVRWLGESNGYYSERVDLFVEGVVVPEEHQPTLSDLLRAKLAD